jgi:hypothetical protein
MKHFMEVDDEVIYLQKSYPPIQWLDLVLIPGRSLPCEVQNHVCPNFATPICTAIKALELYFVHF